MDYNECLNDILIARQALAESLLETSVSNHNLICEVYCLTSFDQTFYLQVYDGEQYTMLFAKPFLHTPHGLSSCAAPFSTIVEAGKHPAYRGDIYCGMKRLPENDETINKLKRCLPVTSEILPESGITLDGNTTLIINHLAKDPVTLYFRNEESFHANLYSPGEVHFLHELHLHIENIIGNLIRSSR